MTPLPQWALEAYQRPGVKDALIALQDEDGQSVLLLLWAAWSHTTVAEKIDRACRVARAHEERIGPLRTSRRALPRGAARDDAARLELEAEMEALTALDRGPGGEGPARLETLVAVAQAWGQMPPPEKLEALARLLA